MLNKLKSAQRGFTIIELLIVIAIIGILAGLVLNNFQGAQAKARDTSRQTDLNNIHGKLEEYYNENGNYPDTFVQATFPGIDEGSLTDPGDVSINIVTAATAATEPADPFTATKPATAQYSYAPYSCVTVSGTTTCAKYILHSWKERPDTTYASFVKRSLN